MSVFKTLVLLFSLSAYVSALVTPKHGIHHRHALAARSLLSSADGHLPPVAKRNLTKRCKTRVNLPSSTSVEPTPTPAPTPTEAPVVNVAPAPTLEPEPEAEAPAPAPAPAPEPEPVVEAPAPAPAPEPEPAVETPAPDPAPSNGKTVHSGDGTFFATGLGACGIVNNDSEFIGAASHLLFDNFPGATGNPNQNPICNKRITINHNGKTVNVAITDRCPTCAEGSIDLSPAAFAVLADFAEGRISIDWTFDDA